MGSVSERNETLRTPSGRVDDRCYSWGFDEVLTCTPYQIDHKLNLTSIELTNTALCNRLGCTGPLHDALMSYWGRLENTYRWQQGDKPISDPQKPLFSENDGQHTTECVATIKRMGVYSPNLAQIINFRDAAIMAVFHDGPEIVTGDTAQTAASRLTEKSSDGMARALTEEDIFFSYILPPFPATAKQRIAPLMKRYYRRDEYRLRGGYDYAAEFAKLIDVWQGMKTAITHLYPNPAMVNPEVLHPNEHLLDNRIERSCVSLFRRIQAMEQWLFNSNGGKMESNAFYQWGNIVRELVAPLRENAYWEFAQQIVHERFPGIESLLGQLDTIEVLVDYEYKPQQRSIFFG